jgi:hypothetical protein
MEVDKLRSYLKDGLVTLTGYQFLEILHDVSCLPHYDLRKSY